MKILLMHNPLRFDICAQKWIDSFSLVLAKLNHMVVHHSLLLNTSGLNWIEGPISWFIMAFNISAELLGQYFNKKTFILSTLLTDLFNIGLPEEYQLLTSRIGLRIKMKNYLQVLQLFIKHTTPPPHLPQRCLWEQKLWWKVISNVKS